LVGTRSQQAVTVTLNRSKFEPKSSTQTEGGDGFQCAGMLHHFTFESVLCCHIFCCSQLYFQLYCHSYFVTDFAYFMHFICKLTLLLLRVLDKAEYSAFESTLNSAIVSYRIVYILFLTFKVLFLLYIILILFKNLLAAVCCS